MQEENASEMELAVGRIRKDIRAVTRNAIKSELRSQKTYRLCDATKEEWLAFADSVEDGLRLHDLAWIDGGLHVVELPSRGRRNFLAFLARKLHNPGPSVGEFLDVRGPGDFTPDLLRHADQSYGPFPWIAQFGARVPKGIDYWCDVYTLLVEAGLQRDWGDALGQLDAAAKSWEKKVSVRYVLCIRIDESLEKCSYKLYERGHHGLHPTTQSPVLVTTDSQSVVPLDSRSLLCLSPGTTLPPDVPETLAIDLSAVLKETCAIEDPPRIAPEFYQTADEEGATAATLDSETKTDSVSAAVNAATMEDSQ